MQNDIFSPPKPRVLVSIYIILFTCFMYISSVAQSCPTLCDPMDCNLSGFSVHGIFQARVLEWVAILVP